MNGRTTIRLGILAVILGCGIYLLDEHLGRRQTMRVQVQRVFDLTVEPVTTIGFERDGKRVEFVRKGDFWFLQSPVRARANSPLVEQTVATLETLRRQDQITGAHREQRGLSLGDYGLAPARARIILETAGGRVEVLSLGEHAPFGGVVYACIGNTDAVFTLPESVLTLFPDDLSAMRDRTLISGSPEKTDRIDIYRRDAGFVRLVRQKTGWILQQPIEARADTAAVRRLLESVFELRVVKFHWDAEALEGADDETAVRMEMAMRGQIEAGGLAEDAARLRLMVWTEGDRLGQEIFVGRSTDGTDSVDVFARKGGVDAVYTVPASILEACAVPVDALRDRAVLYRAVGDVGFIRLQYGETRVELQRATAPAGGGWRLLTPVRAAADSEAVNALIARLQGLRVASYLSAADEQDTAVTNVPLLMISLAPAAPVPAGGGSEKAGLEGAPQVSELYLANPSHDGSGERLARTSAKDEWFTLNADVVKGFDETLVSPLHFRDRLMLAVNPETVFRIQRVTASETLSMERDVTVLSNEWHYAGQGGVGEGKNSLRTADMAAIADLLAAASRLEAGRFIAFMPSNLTLYGLDLPKATMTFGFRSTDAIQNTLLIGALVDEGWYYAMVQGHDFVFLLAAPVVARLLQPLLTQNAPSGAAPAEE